MEKVAFSILDGKPTNDPMRGHKLGHGTGREIEIARRAEAANIAALVCGK